MLPAAELVQQHELQRGHRAIAPVEDAVGEEPSEETGHQHGLIDLALGVCRLPRDRHSIIKTAREVRAVNLSRESLNCFYWLESSGLLSDS